MLVRLWAHIVQNDQFHYYCFGYQIGSASLSIEILLWALKDLSSVLVVWEMMHTVRELKDRGGVVLEEVFRSRYDYKGRASNINRQSYLFIMCLDDSPFVFSANTLTPMNEVSN